MTNPDHTALDAALAAYEQAVASADQADAASLADALNQLQLSQQHLADVTADDQAKTAQVAALQKQVADLQAKLNTAKPAKVLYGASIGGWSISPYKTQTINDAHNDIKTNLGGGKLPVVRAWPSAGKSIEGTPYEDDTCKCYIIEVPQGSTRAQIDAQVKAVPAGSILVPWHEPENDSTDAATWQGFVAMTGASIVASGRKDIVGAVVLMGASYHATRYKDTSGGGTGKPWTYWIPAKLPAGITMIGGDLYPRGKNDASADAASVIIQPALDAAAKMGVPFVVGEFGCGRPTWSDAVRAKFTQDAFALFDANPSVFPAVSLFESCGGAAGPWNVLPNPATGQPQLPQTLAVAKNAVSNS